MNYYILRYDSKKYEKGIIMAYHGEMNGLDRYIVKKGNIIEDWDEGISLFYKLGEGEVATDFLWNNLDWFIISEKFKKVLEDLNIINIQYLPVNIINEISNIKLGDYYVVNATNLIEAVDMDKSEYFEIGDNSNCFLSYSLKKDKINDLDIFRLKEDNIPLFVSEKIYKAVEDYKVAGCSFVQVDIV